MGCGTIVGLAGLPVLHAGYICRELWRSIFGPPPELKSSNPLVKGTHLQNKNEIRKNYNKMKSGSFTKHGHDSRYQTGCIL